MYRDSFSEPKVWKMKQNSETANCIERSITEKDQSTGFVYVAKQTGTQFCKVGFAGQDATGRVRAISRCHIETEITWHTPPFLCAFHAEQIVHKLLYHCRHTRMKCSCGKKNREWFQKDFNVVVSHVQIVYSWMSREPYDLASKELKCSWKDAVELWRQSQDTQAPLKWNDFFLMGPSLDFVITETRKPASAPRQSKSKYFLKLTVHQHTSKSFEKMKPWRKCRTGSTHKSSDWPAKTQRASQYGPEETKSTLRSSKEWESESTPSKSIGDNSEGVAIFGSLTRNVDPRAAGPSEPRTPIKQIIERNIFENDPQLDTLCSPDDAGTENWASLMHENRMSPPEKPAFDEVSARPEPTDVYDPVHCGTTLSTCDRYNDSQLEERQMEIAEPVSMFANLRDRMKRFWRSNQAANNLEESLLRMRDPFAHGGEAIEGEHQVTQISKFLPRANLENQSLRAELERDTIPDVFERTGSTQPQHVPGLEELQPKISSDEPEISKPTQNNFLRPVSDLSHPNGFLAMGPVKVIFEQIPSSTPSRFNETGQDFEVRCTDQHLAEAQISDGENLEKAAEVYHSQTATNASESTFELSAPVVVSSSQVSGDNPPADNFKSAITTESITEVNAMKTLGDPIFSGQKYSEPHGITPIKYSDLHRGNTLPISFDSSLHVGQESFAGSRPELSRENESRTPVASTSVLTFGKSNSLQAARKYHCKGKNIVVRFPPEPAPSVAREKSDQAAHRGQLPSAISHRAGASGSNTQIGKEITPEEISLARYQAQNIFRMCIKKGEEPDALGSGEETLSSMSNGTRAVMDMLEMSAELDALGREEQDFRANEEKVKKFRLDLQNIEPRLTTEQKALKSSNWPEEQPRDNSRGESGTEETNKKEGKEEEEEGKEKELATDDIHGPTLLPLHLVHGQIPLGQPRVRKILLPKSRLGSRVDHLCKQRKDTPVKVFPLSCKVLTDEETVELLKGEA